MKKLLILISALALSITMVNAQMGDGDGMQKRLGDRNIWDALSQVTFEDEVLQNAYDTALEKRRVLHQARSEWEGTIEDFRKQYEGDITALQGALEKLRNWFREFREDRPAPDLDAAGEMLRRRHQYRVNTRSINQVRTQLRACDPDSDECEALKTQLRQLLGERKKLMRGKRGAEGGPGGDGPGREG